MQFLFYAYVLFAYLVVCVAKASHGELGAVHRQCDGFAFLQRGDAGFRVLAWPATYRLIAGVGGIWVGESANSH